MQNGERNLKNHISRFSVYENRKLNSKNINNASRAVKFQNYIFKRCRVVDLWNLKCHVTYYFKRFLFPTKMIKATKIHKRNAKFNFKAILSSFRDTREQHPYFNIRH